MVRKLGKMEGNGPPKLQGGQRRLRGILRPEEGGGAQKRFVTLQAWENWDPAWEAVRIQVGVGSSGVGVGRRMWKLLRWGRMRRGLSGLREVGVGRPRVLAQQNVARARQKA